MIDDADKAVADDERAMELFQEQRRQRIAESMRGYVPPEAPIDCLECGEPVSVERQRAYPHTRRCVHCAEAVERGYRERWPQ